MPFDVGWVQNNFTELTHVERLASGGQKVVFRAIHRIDGPVVLKLINPHQDAVETEREILAVSSISSPRVPTIYEHGTMTSTTGDSVWIREQLISGECLRDTLAGGPLCLDQLIVMTRHILEALVGAEQAQIVHRDVKPDNIVRDAGGSFWLLDFGIARHLGLVSITATANLFGKLTLGYAPAEQMRNNKPFIDTRADLFALGVTIIEASSGDHPFWTPPPGTELEVIKRVENQAINVDFGLSPRAKAFAQLVTTMLQKRRDLRPRTAADALSWLATVEATV